MFASCCRLRTAFNRAKTEAEAEAARTTVLVPVLALVYASIASGYPNLVSLTLASRSRH